MIVMVSVGFPILGASFGLYEATEHRPTNTPPPPYTDPTLATTNALGGVGASLACTRDVAASFGDLATRAGLASAGCTEEGAPGLGLPSLNNPQGVAIATTTRVIALKLTDIQGANTRVCVQLGQIGAVPPSYTCPDSNAAGPTGGCSLLNASESCTLLVRPQAAGCTDYPTCHYPIFASRSAGTTSAKLDIEMFQ